MQIPYDQYEAWCDDNKRLNEKHELKVGDMVHIGFSGKMGEVIKLDIPRYPSYENHGWIEIRTTKNNIIVYEWWDWKKFLRIIGEKNEQ